MFLHVDMSVEFWSRFYSNILIPLNMYYSFWTFVLAFVGDAENVDKTTPISFFLFFEYWKNFAEKYLQVVLSGDDIEADQAERWGSLMWKCWDTKPCNKGEKLPTNWLAGFLPCTNLWIGNVS